MWLDMPLSDHGISRCPPVVAEIVRSMYGLPVETDLTPLVGTDVTYVGVGQFMTHVAFSGPPDSSITIEGEFSLEIADRRVTFSESVDGGGALLALLGQSVTSAVIPTDGTVRIAFSNGTTLEVPDDSEQYESYQLNLSGRELIV